jgi:hypothetical protein
MSIPLTREDIQTEDILVFYDQDGRMNPRFCIVVNITPRYVYMRNLIHTRVDKYPPKEDEMVILQDGTKIPKYRSSTEHILTPTNEEVGEPFRIMYKKLTIYNKYDPNKEYIQYWYD